MNKRVSITLFYLLFSFILTAQKNGRLEILDTKVFDTKLIHLKGNLIDLRTPEEFAEGAIKGAKNINWESKDFKKEIKNIPTNQPVFIYCAGGYRSKEAAEWMIKNGFSTVIMLENGYDAWKEVHKSSNSQEN
jgi:rhodanese-related sulfurtransferase